MGYRKPWPAVVALVSATALAASACQSDARSDTPAEAPDDGEELIYVEAITGDPGGLNPQFSGGPIVNRITFSMYESLVEITDEYEIQPGLAREWEISEDERTITFHLEEGVVWHDGEPFTADDVTFNFEEIVPLQTWGAMIAARMESVEAPDEYTVVLNLERPFGPLFEALSQQAMVPKHLYEGTDYVTNPHNMAPVGTGPMMFVEFNPGAEVVLERNPNWWRGETQVDRTIFTVMTDPNTRALAMLNGELDGAVLDPSKQADVSEHPDLMQVERGYFQDRITVVFNAEQPELADPAVRALVFSAIDRDDVVRLALDGLGTPAESFFLDMPPGARHPDISFSEEFPRDITAIAQGLDAAGYPVTAEGHRFTIDARYVSTHAESAATAEVLRANLAEVDIAVNLVGASQPVWQEAVYETGDYGMSILRHTSGADPTLGFTRWLACNPDKRAHANSSGVCDEDLTAAADASNDSFDIEKRIPYLYEIQERAQELIFWAPLAWTNAVNPTVNLTRWKNIEQITGRTNSIPWQDLEWQG